MVRPFHPKPLSLFSSSSSSSSSSCLISMKIKTLIQTLLFRHLRRLLRSLSAAKSKAVSALLVHGQQTLQLVYTTKRSKNKKSKRNNKIFFGSFRLHYNWCSSKSSHVLPVPASVYDGLYYDATWNSVIPTGPHNGLDSHNIDQHGSHESRLYGYLQWLEEEKKLHDKNGGASAGNRDHDHEADHTVEAEDIDKLADLFIASCHAKFILEKQESARRFKEMLERSA